VAFKSSIASDEQRKAVLANFMTNQSSGGETKENADDATKQEIDVIKELLMALSKKL
jgi:hypothetical protein